MTNTPSYQRIDYSVRTNKNIERKLVFDLIKRLNNHFQLSGYRYIGLGSMWFVDFVLAHRILSIDSMWSIELPRGVARAEFNKPYACIEVKSGSTSLVLSKMQDEEWRKPSIAWFDYDGRLDADVLDDCDKYLRKVAVGSFLIVTVNAFRNTYKVRDGDAEKTSLTTLKELLGNAVPAFTDLPEHKDVAVADFPPLLSTSLLDSMSRSVRTSGRETEQVPDRFVPLFNFLHVDNAPMITVGGIVVSQKQLSELEQLFGIDAAGLVAGRAATKDTLELIPITTKEKLALDRLLPCPEGELHERLIESGVKLERDQANSYRRLYKHFPVFAETFV